MSERSAEPAYFFRHRHGKTWVLDLMMTRGSVLENGTHGKEDSVCFAVIVVTSSLCYCNDCYVLNKSLSVAQTSH